MEMIENRRVLPAIYLTGAPATGKTTTAKRLSYVHGADVWSYGEILTDEIEEISVQSALREQSSDIISSEIITDLDRRLIDYLQTRQRPVIIDSHAVTKEKYGFRCLPFSSSILPQLGLTDIVCLYSTPRVVAERIRRSPDGRPLPSMFEIEIHLQGQIALALSYAQSIGVPCYLICSDGSIESVCGAIAQACGLV